MASLGRWGGRLVTVVTPVYNRGPHLRKTVVSVLEQTFEDFVYLLVDDGSGAETQEALFEMEKLDDRVRVFRRANSGAAMARSYGLEQSEGEYLAFLDHDDWWLPEKLSRQVEYLRASPSDGWVYCRIRFEHEDGPVVGDFADLFGLQYWSGWVTEQLLRYQNFVATYSAPLLRTELVRRVGGPQADTGISDDWDLFLRLSTIARLGFVDETLVRYNCGNAASQSHNLAQALQSEQSVIAKHAQLLGKLSVTSRWATNFRLRLRWARWARELGWRSQRHGDFSAAARYYLQAARLHPGVFATKNALKDIAQVVRRGTKLYAGR